MYKCSPGPVPIRLYSNVITIHWHEIDVNKMFTLLKLRPTNADDIMLTFSLCNLCIQTLHWTRLCSHTLPLEETMKLCIVTSHLGAKTFSHRCFLGISYWLPSNLDTSELYIYAYNYHLTKIPGIYLIAFVNLHQKLTFCRMSLPQCQDINVMTFDTKCHEICLMGWKTNAMTSILWD